MSRWFALMLVVPLFAPAAAEAQNKAFVAMGTEVTLTFDRKILGVSKPAKITPNAFETATGAEFARGEHQEAMGPVAKPMTTAGPRAPSGLIVVRLTPIAGEKPGSLLVIANGYDRAFVWRAQIRVAGKMQPTDVCLIMPGKSGVEHWPYAIQSISLTQTRLEPWTPADGIRCE